MTNTTLLQDAISKSGVTVTWLAHELGISREGLYNKINGKTEFKASEVVSLTRLLHLNQTKREQIFLLNNMNIIHYLALSNSV